MINCFWITLMSSPTNWSQDATKAEFCDCNYFSYIFILLNMTVPFKYEIQSRRAFTKYFKTSIDIQGIWPFFKLFYIFFVHDVFLLVRSWLVIIFIFLQALGFQMPYFAHVSLILAPDKSKLSKRHGATSVGQVFYYITI